MGMRCASCGRELPSDALFCMTCGAEVSLAPTQVRKTVTILFSDVAGSTALADALDPETVRRVMGRYFDACRSVLEAHGGTVEKFIGDAVMAVFGVPVVHEDDAMRAVRAACAIREELALLNETFEPKHGVRIVVRTGINTGEVMAGDPGAGQAFVSGDTVNVAARLEQTAPNDEILISDSTRQLVRDSVTVEAVEPLTLKGKPDPFRAYRLVAIDPGGEGLLRRRQGRLIGRSEQLEGLKRTFERAVKERRCFLVTVIGEPGVGKSRLVETFTEGIAERATVLHGRCRSYGEGITFFPVAEIVSEAIGAAGEDGPEEIASKIERLIMSDEDAPLVAARLLRMLGLGSKDSQGATEEIFWAFRKLLESLANRDGVVAVIDDIQWAEPALLDLLEHVCDLSRDAGVLLVCMARPDIYDERPGWGAGRANASSIVLERLDERDSRALAAQLIETTPLPSELTERILDAADGNPLFMEQVVAHLVDQALTASEHRADEREITIPRSLTALLEARLDRLSDLQRAVLQRGSIEGQVFHRGAVSTLLPPELRAEVATSFGPLMQKEFIASGDAELVGEDAFRFRHALIKDAAYRALPKETRAELHSRLADWLEVAAGRRLPEFQEIIGHHLETAFRYREELGGAEGWAELAERAVEHLSIAGDLARNRGDVRAAASMLQRAVALSDRGSPERVPLLLRLAEAVESAGRTVAARTAWQEIDEAFERATDERLRALIEIQRLNSIMVDDDGDWFVDVQTVVERAIRVFEGTGDDDGLARAHFLRGFAEWMQFRASAAASAWELAATHAHEAGETGREAETLGWIAAAGLFGATPVDEAVRRQRDMGPRLAGSVLAEGMVEGCLSNCLALRGDDEGARAVLNASLERWSEHGLKADLAHYGSQFVAWIERCAGNADEELRAWLDGLEASRKLDQENRFLASVAAVLLAARGDIDEAVPLIELAHPDEWAHNLHMRTVLLQASAIVEARRGNVEEARRQVREVTDMMAPTEILVLTGDAWMSTALIERLLGNQAASDAAVERAIQLYSVKGAIALIPPARSWQRDRSRTLL
jgi:class 3 adenylate cyclase/tetratricopeptide (TPR) repeat protein